MSTGRQVADDFAAALLAAGLSPRLTARRLSTARAFLTDRPDPSTWTPAGAEEWMETRELGKGTISTYRSHLRSLFAFTDGLSPALRPAPVEPTAHARVSLATFRRWLTEQAASPTLVRHRSAVVASFLVDHSDFLDLPDEAIEQWLDERRLTKATRATYRGHLRSLYRWAASAGLSQGTRLHVSTGPGSASSVTVYGRGRVLLPITPAWQRVIEPWVDWMASAGRPPTSLYLREYQVRRLGNAHPRLDPFAVTTDDLARWMAGQTWQNETRRSYRAALRSFYGWAHATGQMTSNPAAVLPPVLPTRAQSKPAPDARISDALATADDRVRLMLLLGAQAGLRRAEIATLHTRCLVTSSTGYALRITGKGGHERLVPVSGAILERVRTSPAGYVFPGNDDGHLSPARVGELLSEVLGPNLTAHSLRHRFATAVYAPTQDLLATQKLLGHASPVTTQRYVQIPDDVARALVGAAATFRT